MSNFIRRVDNAICSKLLNFIDMLKDRHICGQSLVPYVPSIYRDNENGIGGTGTQSSHYIILNRVFSKVKITKDDAYIDVGCGKGRVLAFLIKKKYPCKLYGVEHNEAVGRIAAEWTKHYPQVHIMIGDALTMDYNPFTVIGAARPFLRKTLLVFVEHLENTLTHPITMIYWYGVGPKLEGRPGWTLEYEDTLNRIWGLKIASCPQTFSIWTYDPKRR